MKQYLFSLTLGLIGIGFITFGCLTNEMPVKKPVAVEYYKVGDTLLPSYASPDTLIVRDAKGLNESFAYVEQDISWGSDADIDSLIHIYCDTYSK